MKKKVCIYNLPYSQDIEGYQLDSFNLEDYFKPSMRWGLYELFMGGWNGFWKLRSINYCAYAVDRLYRDKDPVYMRMARDFVERFHDHDLVVMYHANIIHPEILNRELKKPIKIYGFIDDPYSTYLRGIPYLWAFDGAFYNSPSYGDFGMFDQALAKWGCPNNLWWPLVTQPFRLPETINEDFYRNRQVELIYVGNPAASKVDRLRKLKSHFGTRMQIYGRWRFAGYYGWMRPLLGKPIFPWRVAPISSNERTQLYWNTKIGINMHLSDIPMETGNMRMYELPAHGVMMLCDRAAFDAQEMIFKGGDEAIYYDSFDDLIEKAEHYLAHDQQRMDIAKAGFERFWQDYEWERNMKRLLDWAMQIPK